jgi:hypothetical protein
MAKGSTRPVGEARIGRERALDPGDIADDAGEPGIAGDQGGLFAEHAERKRALACLPFEDEAQPARQPLGGGAAGPFDIALEFGPGAETVLARDDRLRVVEPQRMLRESSEGQVACCRQSRGEALQRLARALAGGVQQALGLLAQVVEIRGWGKM